MAIGTAAAIGMGLAGLGSLWNARNQNQQAKQAGAYGAQQAAALMGMMQGGPSASELQIMQMLGALPPAMQVQIPGLAQAAAPQGGGAANPLAMAMLGGGAGLGSLLAMQRPALASGAAPQTQAPAVGTSPTGESSRSLAEMLGFTPLALGRPATIEEANAQVAQQRAAAQQWRDSGFGSKENYYLNHAPGAMRVTMRLGEDGQPAYYTAGGEYIGTSLDNFNNQDWDRLADPYQQVVPNDYAGNVSADQARQNTGVPAGQFVGGPGDDFRNVVSQYMSNYGDGAALLAYLGGVGGEGGGGFGGGNLNAMHGPLNYGNTLGAAGQGVAAPQRGADVSAMNVMAPDFAPQLFATGFAPEMFNGATGTQGFNTGQDWLMQALRADPRTSVDVNLNSLISQGGQPFDTSGLFGALEATNNRRTQEQVSALQASSSGLGQRVGGAKASQEASLRAQLEEQFAAQRAQIGMQAHEAGLGRVMQTLGMQAGREAQWDANRQAAAQLLQQGGLAQQGLQLQGTQANNAALQAAEALRLQGITQNNAQSQFAADQALRAQLANQASGLQASLANQSNNFNFANLWQQGLMRGQELQLQANQAAFGNQAQLVQMMQQAELARRAGNMQLMGMATQAGMPQAGPGYGDAIGDLGTMIMMMQMMGGQQQRTSAPAYTPTIRTTF